MRRWLRTPAVHFALIGGFLFALVQARRPPPVTPATRPIREPIVISAATVRQLRADFMQQFGTPPSRGHLRALIEQAIDDELLYREARRLKLDFQDGSVRLRLVQKMRAVGADPLSGTETLVREAARLGLDDDLVIRRILREKMRLFLRQDPAGTPVREEEVRAYVERHRDRFAQPHTVTFSHVFLSRRVHGDHARQKADAVLAELGAQALLPEAAEELSDPFPLGLAQRGWSRHGIARAFGEPFAAAVFDLAPGTWGGPIASPFGLHLVWVHEKAAGAMPLEVIRPQVARLLAEERAAHRLAGGLRYLRSQYEVRVESFADVAIADTTPRSHL